MANAFKNARKALVTSAGAAVYTCPASTTAIVLLAQVANVDGTNTAQATVTWWDDSAEVSTSLCFTTDIPPDTAMSVIAGKLVLEAGDAIFGVASADSDLVMSVSVLEIS